MATSTEGLVSTLMSLPIFEAEWVLWLLIGLSLVSVGVMIERIVFFATRRVNIVNVRQQFAKYLDNGDFAEAARFLSRYDSMETNVVLFGLREHQKGADAVEELLNGALSKEKLRYERLLTFMATVGNNSPFIGLFGTVLGIIKAFADLAGNLADATSAVMSGISEALIATAIGLLVAIPAVIANNAFRSRVKVHLANTELLARTLLAQLKADDAGIPASNNQE